MVKVVYVPVEKLNEQLVPCEQINEQEKVEKHLEEEKLKSNEKPKDKTNKINKILLSFYLKYKDQHPEFIQMK